MTLSLTRTTMTSRSRNRNKTVPKTKTTMTKTKSMSMSNSILPKHLIPTRKTTWTWKKKKKKKKTTSTLTSTNQPTASEALEVLAMIELKFALLREKVYLEKMDELAWEEGLLLGNANGPANGIHPELQHIQSELLLRKNRRLELAERKCAYECENVRKRRRIDEVDVWSTWKLQKETLQTDMIAENNRKRRKLERERRAADRPTPPRRIPPPPPPIPSPTSEYYLPPPPSFMQVVDSYSMTFGAVPKFLATNSGTGTGTLPLGANGRKPHRTVNGATRKSLRSSNKNSNANAKSHRTNGHSPGSAHPVSSPFVGFIAYPELSTLSSSEAQGDLEALFVAGGFGGGIGGGHGWRDGHEW
ncbi:hypothetical protein BT96DRAFT_480218 [Gymnopus androsaceus JB14]|uniref:Uncharacterized protein n=1 Tax=Gymnopus androsaceus JB14 TaxID=1447944 RepID=A0A6A4I0R4_9AGAR|nr:hypothetical protein BT96DRAFT_480218 [Gymnopus androsaceus JB14]